MQEHFERTIGLFGTTPDEQSFADYIQELGDTPQKYFESKLTIEYGFNKSGIYLSYFKGPRCFAHLFFHSKSTQPKPPYPGDFPNEIAFGDTRSIVRQKMKLLPASTKPVSLSIWDEFLISNDVLLGFGFSEETDKLVLASARFIPAWDMENQRPKATRDF